MMTLINLKSDSCRFIVSGDERPTWYCGETAKDGSSYCPEHHAVCYQPIKSRHDAEVAQRHREPARQT
jgi:hypothetical protein